MAAEDTFELLSRETTTDIWLSGKHPNKGRSIIAKTKAYFKRYVLLSGKYSIVDEETRPKAFISGWRAGSLASCLFVAGILCFNIIFTVYCITTSPPSEDGVGEISSGPCNSILSSSAKIHIAINIFSTIIVGASNYNMQCLTAPTRAEVDRAHAKGKKMEIGIMSVRNLCQVSTWKAALWAALLLSTLPLHLLWNSAIFSVTTLNQYAALVVTPDFLENQNIYGNLDCSTGAVAEYQASDSTSESYATCWLLQQAEIGALTKIGPSECIKKYASKLERDSYNLIAVTKENGLRLSTPFMSNGTNSVLAYFDSMSYSNTLTNWCRAQCTEWCTPWNLPDPCIEKRKDDWVTTIVDDPTQWCGSPNWDSSITSFSCYQYATNGSAWSWDSTQGPSNWTCHPDHVYDNRCTASVASRNSSHWIILPESYEIDHCLVSSATFQCQLQYSPAILYAVIGCNAIKFLAILCHLIFAKEPIFAAFGDAISSFLIASDPTTKGNCLLTAHDRSLDKYRRAPNWWGGATWKPRLWQNDRNSRDRWAEATSLARLMMCCGIWTVFLILTGIYFDEAKDYIGSMSIWEAGFGSMNTQALVSTSAHERGSNASILTTSLVVNTPQLLFSTLYFMYNSMYTCMTSAHEWSLFAKYRKTLPWKFSIPLMAMSALLHWLISQSLFLANVRIQSVRNTLVTRATDLPMVSKNGTVTAAGFSPLAIILAIIIGTLMLLALLGICCLRLAPGITLVGSDSLAISAACHAPREDTQAAMKPILWGAVSHQDGAKPGHCCLTSFEVEEPRIGQMYA